MMQLLLTTGIVAIVGSGLQYTFLMLIEANKEKLFRFPSPFLESCAFAIGGAYLLALLLGIVVSRKDWLPEKFLVYWFCVSLLFFLIECSTPNVPRLPWAPQVALIGFITGYWFISLPAFVLLAGIYHLKMRPQRLNEIASRFLKCSRASDAQDGTRNGWSEHK